MFHVHEEHRMKTGPLASTSEKGNNGAFAVHPLRGGRWLLCIVSDGMGWEHVSVHVQEYDRGGRNAAAHPSRE